MLVACKDYGYTAPGQIGLASLGPYDSPPPGHVNSMVAMYIKTNDAATINLRFAAQHFARLAASLNNQAMPQMLFARLSLARSVGTCETLW